MNQSREAQALDVLQSELGKLGIESERNFHVPGGQFELDLYIPSLPRAAVEIKHVRIAEQMSRGIEYVRKIKQWGRRELGAAFIPILLVIRLPNTGSAAVPDWPRLPSGIETIVIDADTDDAQTMVLAASKIGEIFNKKRDKFMHTVAAATLATSLASGGLVLGGIAASAAPIGALVPGVWGLLNDALKGIRTKTKVQNTAESHVLQPETTAPDPEALNIITSQIDSILLSFRELAPDAHEVAEHELRFLVEEFQSGHFTACAMRGGRCLESMVYELSRRWGIELRDSTFGALNEVRKALDGLETALGDFEAAEDGQREGLSMKLDTAQVKLNNCTMSAFMAIKAVQTDATKRHKADGGPRPVIALLKRIRSRYGKLDGVTQILNEVLPSKGRESPVARILDARNRAAHAHLEGKPQEIDAATVTKLIDDINLVMLRLSNVGIAIQQSRSEA
jgi:hypothetical protein